MSNSNNITNNDMFSLYLAFLVNKYSSFKYKVMNILKGHDELLSEVFSIIPCSIDGLETPMNAMKLFAPDLYRDDRSIKENLEILEAFLKEKFFNKSYVIEGSDLKLH